MFDHPGRRNGKGWLAAFTLVALLLTAGRALAEIDRSLYMSPDEVRPGMKGFGRTVMSGTTIDTFNIEVISVMHNAYYAKQAIILIRCSGLNLEHTGVIGGMSGSPCYLRDDQGRERMIGAVAYGWTFSKDPICGVQPITQMLEVAEVRKARPETQPAVPSRPAGPATQARHEGGIPLEDWVAKAVGEPIPAGCRLSVLNPPGPFPASARAEPPSGPQGLRPLEIPVTVSGATQETMDFIGKWLRRYGLTPVAAGPPAPMPGVNPDAVRLEPGSALCVAMMTGDITIEGIGTCTVTLGDQVLGFGHQLFGEGSVEMPLATGFIHTVIPSIARSNKMGGALKVVGTLWGDESTAVSGTVGRTPRMVPLEVVVNDVRGRQTYRYEVVHEEFMTGAFLGTGVMESVYAHSLPPRDHTVRHTVEIDFGELGTYKAANVSAQRGVSEPVSDIQYPVLTLLNAPIAQKARVQKARAEITIEDTARSATIYQVDIPRTVYKPGETVTAKVQWTHYRREPLFTFESYSLKLPDDIPDGDYELSFCSALAHAMALKSEKPHLFRAETLSQALATLNLLGSLPDDKLYMRLNLKRGGVAYKQVEMPDLPPSRRRVLNDSRLTADLNPYTEALVVTHPTDFVVGGRHSVQIQVKRRPDT